MFEADIRRLRMTRMMGFRKWKLGNRRVTPDFDVAERWLNGSEGYGNELVVVS
jgi:hypothetical protein